jgi:hypothetical protein
MGRRNGLISRSDFMPKPDLHGLPPAPAPVRPPTLPLDFRDIRQSPGFELQPTDPSSSLDKASAGAMAVSPEREPARTVEPSEDETLQKAKELCREDGKVWNSADFEGGSPTEVAAIATDSDHTEYLNRARALLKQK